MSERYRKSQQLFERAQRSLAGGVGSPFRAEFPVPLYLPLPVQPATSYKTERRWNQQIGWDEN